MESLGNLPMHELETLKLNLQLARLHPNNEEIISEVLDRILYSLLSKKLPGRISCSLEIRQKYINLIRPEYLAQKKNNLTILTPDELLHDIDEVISLHLDDYFTDVSKEYLGVEYFEKENFISLVKLVKNSSKKYSILTESTKNHFYFEFFDLLSGSLQIDLLFQYIYKLISLNYVEAISDVIRYFSFKNAIEKDKLKIGSDEYLQIKNIIYSEESKKTYNFIASALCSQPEFSSSSEVKDCFFQLYFNIKNEKFEFCIKVKLN